MLTGLHCDNMAEWLRIGDIDDRAECDAAADVTGSLSFRPLFVTQAWSHCIARNKPAQFDSSKLN